MPWVNVDGPTAAHHHHPRPGLQHLQVVSEVDVGQVLDDDVEAGAEVLHHLLLVTLMVVVEDVVRAALEDHVHPLLRPGRSHHCCSNSSKICIAINGPIKLMKIIY